jgi:SAM-dependent methyltransferase
MLVPLKVRQRVKAILRPAVSPLLWRLRLPFEVMLPRIEHLERAMLPRIEHLERAMLPRIEHLERRVEAIPPPPPPDHALRESVNNLRGTVDSVTRMWLRLQNEMARLAADVPEAAAYAARAQSSELEARLQTVEQQLQVAEQQLQSTNQQLHDDIAGRGHRVDDTLRFLLERVEFVRREMLFELRYGANGHPALPAQARVLEPRILATEKVKAARTTGTLRLNVGCGHIVKSDYINVDMRELPGIDVVAEAGALPFEPGTVDEIFSAHLVEHFPQEEMRRRLLPYWYRLLRPGGLLRAVTPDGEAMLAGLTQGSCSFEDFRMVVFGGQDYEGDFHYNLFTPESLSRLVEEAGFGTVRVPVRGRRNDRCFEFELIAEVPAVTRRECA